MSGGRLISVRELAEELFGAFTPTNRNRVYNFIEANNLKRLRDGKKWWIVRADLEALLKGGER